MTTRLRLASARRDAKSLGLEVISKVRQGPVCWCRTGLHGDIYWSFSSASCGTLASVEVEADGCDVEAAGAVLG